MINNALVYWITGLSGSGKTTIANSLQKLLMQKKNCNSIVVDGDKLRWAVADPNCRYDYQSRTTNAYRISRFTQLIADQGVPVIVATISLFHEIHTWNRKNLPNYFEIYLQTKEETLKRRDPKKIYQKVNQGIENEVVGFQLGYDQPENPHLIINNDCDMSDVSNIAETILTASELYFNPKK